jgi:xanthine dehydrogenase accessory factor
MNHLYHLLDEYLLRKNEELWACASVVTRSGSSYRWPGAMMMISPMGKSYGLVSGGCLESDVIRRAQKVSQMRQTDYVIYDTADEESFAASLGLGCNGKIGVLIQEVSFKHHELLVLLHQRMQLKQSSYLLQCFQSDTQEHTNHWLLLDELGRVLITTINERVENYLKITFEDLMQQLPERQAVQIIEGNHWAIAKITPPIHLWVLGGGLDAEPVVEIAATLGWLVTVVDHRVGYARETNFSKASDVLNVKPEQAAVSASFKLADAFICMTHNKNIDASWMRQIVDAPEARYIALLGPVTRKTEVMGMANVPSSFSDKVFGPAGSEQIIGDLPESIALSMIAQCHTILQS